MLGPSFEALDPIRTFHFCHIVYDPPNNAFSVLVNRDEKVRNPREQVRKAIGSIENAILEFKASNSIPVATYVVHPPDSVSARKLVGIRDGSVRGSSEKHRTLYLCGEALSAGEFDLWEHERLGAIRTNQLKMQSTMVQTLNRVCFHRGKVQIRVQFGSFNIDKLLWGTPNVSDTSLQRFFLGTERYVLEGRMNQL